MFNFAQKFADYISYSVFNLVGTHIGDALNFFIYDSIKIFILIFLVVNFMTILNHFLPIEKIRDFLAKNKFYGFDYFLSSVFGAITPFCSCSSIPMFIGFLKAGIPLGITFSFLITSPLINEVAIALFIGLFGWKVTIIYIVSGILLGMLGGFIMGKLKMEKEVSDFFIEKKCSCKKEKEIFTWKSFFKKSSKDSFKLIKKITPYVLVGIAIGGLIHGFIPAGELSKYISEDNFFAVPIAVILAIPMYSNSAGVLPIIQSLITAGIPMGTGLAFMMGVVGLSLPEFLILKKVMSTKLLITFFSIVGFCMILLGYLFNFIF